MKNILILIPVYNDWESLKKLLDEINKLIKDINQVKFKCTIIDDGSSITKPNLEKPSNFTNFKVISMKENKGHARCNAFGLIYSLKHEKFDFIILMDGDGEDRPEEIEKLVLKTLENNSKSVVAKRVKRSENIFFRTLYQIHKVITFVFTGNLINFGNYSCLTKNDVLKLSKKKSLWRSFSGSVKKNIKNLESIRSERGKRYFGPSKMSLLKLIIHSLSIMSVFKLQLVLRSILFIFLSIYLGQFSNFVSIFLILGLNLFMCSIFIIWIVDLKKKYEYTEDDIKNVLIS